MNNLIMKINGEIFEIETYDNPSTQALIDSLPTHIKMSRWGGEYYGTIQKQIPADSAMKSFFEEGEVALWPDGNAYCIFFGPTPASTDHRPKMASPGIAFGKIVSDNIDSLDNMSGQIQIELTVK